MDGSSFVGSLMLVRSLLKGFALACWEGSAVFLLNLVCSLCCGVFGVIGSLVIITGSWARLLLVVFCGVIVLVVVSIFSRSSVVWEIFLCIYCLVQLERVRLFAHIQITSGSKWCLLFYMILQLFNEFLSNNFFFSSSFSNICF